MINNELQVGYVKFLVNLPGQYMVSLAFNRNVTIDYARKKIIELHKSIDRRLLGRRFCYMPIERRSSFSFVFEHLATNVHCHGFWGVGEHNLGRFETLCCVPIEDRGERLSRPLPVECVDRPKFELGVWKNIVASGTSRVVPIWDRWGAAEYTTKEIGKGWDTAALFLSEEIPSGLV